MKILSQMSLNPRDFPFWDTKGEVLKNIFSNINAMSKDRSDLSLSVNNVLSLGLFLRKLFMISEVWKNSVWCSFLVVVVSELDGIFVIF